MEPTGTGEASLTTTATDESAASKAATFVVFLNGELPGVQVEDLIIATTASVAAIASQRMQFSYRDLDMPGRSPYVEANIPLASASEAASFTRHVESGGFSFSGPGYARNLYGALADQVHNGILMFPMDYAMIDTAEFKAELHSKIEAAGVHPEDVLAISLAEGSIVANVTTRTRLVANQLKSVVDSGGIAMGGGGDAGVVATFVETELEAILPTTATEQTPNGTTLVPITMLDPGLNGDLLQLIPTDNAAASVLSGTNLVIVITASILIFVIIIVLIVSRHHTTRSEETLLKRLSPFSNSSATNPLAAPYSPDPTGKFSAHFYPTDAMLPRYNRASVKKKVSAAGGRLSKSLSPLSQASPQHDYFDPLPGPFGLSMSTAAAMGGGPGDDVSHHQLRPQESLPHVGLGPSGGSHYYPKDFGFMGRASTSPQVLTQGDFATAGFTPSPQQQQQRQFVDWGETEAMLLRASQSPPRSSGVTPGGLLLNPTFNTQQLTTLSPIEHHHQQMQNHIRAQQALQQVGLNHIDQGRPGAVTMFGAPTPAAPPLQRRTTHYSPQSPGYIDVEGRFDYGNDVSMGLDLSGVGVDDMHNEFMAFEQYLLDAGPAAAIAAANANGYAAGDNVSSAEYLAVQSN